MRFLSISANNLDEFFMVRVAGLKGQVRAGITHAQPRRPDAGRAARPHRRGGFALWPPTSSTVGASCAGNSARMASCCSMADALKKADRNWLADYFFHNIFPVLTPLAIDPGHPFPFIPNLGFSIALHLDRASDGKPMNALIRVPPKIERFIRLPSPADGGPVRLITLEQVTRSSFPPVSGIHRERSGRVPRDPRFRSRNRGRGRGPGSPLRERAQAAPARIGDPART